MAEVREGAPAARRGADKPFSALTLAELRRRAVELEHRAAVLREEQRHSVPTSAVSMARARRLVAVAGRAAEYAELVRIAEERSAER